MAFYPQMLHLSIGRMLEFWYSLLTEYDRKWRNDKTVRFLCKMALPKEYADTERLYYIGKYTFTVNFLS